MAKRAIRINNADNVAVALSSLKAGEEHFGVTLKCDIIAGHKLALSDIPAGGEVIKYGCSIGRALVDIKAGDHVHTHNLKTALKDKEEYTYNRAEAHSGEPFSATVNVYPRAGGGVGIRNEIFIVPTVGCVNAQASRLAELFRAKATECDGVFSLTHPYGCSQTGDDHNRTVAVLRNIVTHPNAGGVLVLGLGCENNRIDLFKEALGEFDDRRIRFITAQEVPNEIEAGISALEEIYSVVKTDKRQPRDISCLNIGLKCGGSDGLSGITANPLLGLVTNRLVSAGAAAVLTEVPEMFGAERLLMNRAKNEQVFSQTVKLINDFKDFYLSHNQPVYENPSPGNKEGGITTLEDKSLGCTQKCGSCEVSDVIFDGGIVKERGLSLLNGPGNDIVAITNLGAAGCHMVLFTTGRGTPLGGFIPTVKVSTNTELANKKPSWIDFNAGQVLEQGFDAALEELTSLIIRVANGEKTKNECFGARDIAIFKTGVTL